MSTNVEDWQRRFGSVLREAITRSGKTYAEISSEYETIFNDHMRASTLSRIVAGAQKPYIHQAYALCMILRCSLESVVEGECSHVKNSSVSPTVAGIVAVIGEKEAIRRLTKTEA